MTLKIEDCKAGAEIICINSTFAHVTKNPLDYYYDWVKLGNIYTIRGLIRSKNPKRPGEPAILLEEIKGRVPKTFEAKEYAFNLWRFKPVDPRAIQIFYDILKKPLVTEEKSLVDC